MTLKQAQNLLTDLRKSLQIRDYCEDLYLSIKDVGTKVFRSCAYFETESWVFIWTIDDSFVFSKKLIGDFVLVHPNETYLSLKKEKPVYGN
jgi:hypothetical protein